MYIPIPSIPLLLYWLKVENELHFADLWCQIYPAISGYYKCLSG